MINDTMISGVEYRIGWTFKTAPLVPKDITGWTVLVQIRPSKSSETIIAEFTNGDEGLTINGTAGTVDLFIKPSVVASYSFKDAVMDCWIVNPEDTDAERTQAVHLAYCRGVSRN